MTENTATLTAFVASLVAVASLVVHIVKVRRTNGNAGGGYVSKELKRLDTWAGNQENRLRGVEVWRAKCSEELGGIKREQTRTADAIEALTKEVRRRNNGHGT